MKYGTVKDPPERTGLLKRWLWTGEVNVLSRGYSGRKPGPAHPES